MHAAGCALTDPASRRPSTCCPFEEHCRRLRTRDAISRISANPCGQNVFYIKSPIKGLLQQQNDRSCSLQNTVIFIRKLKKSQKTVSFPLLATRSRPNLQPQRLTEVAILSRRRSKSADQNGGKTKTRA